MNRRLTAVIALVMLLGGNAYADGGPTRVSGPTPFEAGCAGETGPGTLYRNAEVQPHLAVDPRDPRHLLGTYQQDRWSSVASQGALTAVSFDGGRTWKRSTAPISECTGGNPGNGGDFKRATDSWVSISPDGTAYWATMSMTGGILEPGSRTGIMVSRSADGGVTWGAPKTLIRESPPAFDDLPSVTADPAGSRFVYLVWTRILLLDETRFEGPAYFTRSTDGGHTWEASRPIHNPGVNAQTVANKIVVLPDGTLVNGFSRYSQDPVSLEYKYESVVIRSTDRGQTWSAPVEVGDMAGIGAKDPDAGTPLRTGHEFTQLAADGRGNVYSAWQDARFSGGQRDGIVLSRSVDGGRTWSAPVAVNKDLSVQAFSPALAVRRDGTIGVSYYDFRANTPDPATLPTKYWLATSGDGGATWSERGVAGPFDFAVAPKVERPAGALYLGDYHGLVAAGNDFVALFPVTTADTANRTDILTESVSIR
jgi:hypothetical protein